MKTKDAVKMVDEGWVKKRGGYRVRFQRLEDSEIITDYTPGEKDKPLDSDVVAWRLAWTLAKASSREGSLIEEGELINLCVVDDTGEPVKYYATNTFEIFNPKSGE